MRRVSGARRTLGGVDEHRSSKKSGTPYEQCRLDEIAARWDARSETWDRSVRQPACHLNEDGAYARFLDQVEAVIATRKQFCANGGVIDAGCGTGLVLAHVVAHFGWGIGVDISRKMIQSARGKSIPNARFLKWDIFGLSCACPATAAILSRGVLVSHYGQEQGSALLAEFRKTLVPGGFLILDFLNVLSLGSHRHLAENKTYFHPAEIREMARAAGFDTARTIGRMERRVLLLMAELNG